MVLRTLANVGWGISPDELRAIELKSNESDVAITEQALMFQAKADHGLMIAVTLLTAGIGLYGLFRDRVWWRTVFGLETLSWITISSVLFFQNRVLLVQQATQADAQSMILFAAMGAYLGVASVATLLVCLVLDWRAKQRRDCVHC